MHSDNPAGGRVMVCRATGALACAGLMTLALPVCSGPQQAGSLPAVGATQEPGAARQPGGLQDAERFTDARAALVAELRRQGIQSEQVLAAIDRVPRARFVAEADRDLAYANHPLPIGHGQTISQPFIVALMSELLETEAGDRVLEIGTGSGYQAAILAELGCEVFSIEIVGALAASAQALLHELDYGGVHLRHGDGYLGWPEEAPFDKVIVTAAPEEIPDALVAQLKVGGKMVIPVGPRGAVQQLTLLEKGADGEVRTTRILSVAFVPMVR